MIRRKQKVRNILKREYLNTTTYESEAAKIFMKFLREHPELNEDDVEMDIDEWEEEDDYRGNGGGWYRAVEIYTEREETDEEYNARITQEEHDIISKHSPTIRKAIYDLRWDMNLQGDKKGGKRLYDLVVDIVKDVFTDYV